MYQNFLVFLKIPRIIALLLAGSVAWVTFSNTWSIPLFSTTDPFVLLATEQLTLEQDTQVSSGNLGSNEMLALDKDVLVTGDLFGKTITLDKGTTINGNASFNKLKLHKEAQILGIQTKPVQLPIANLSDIPDFQVGTQDVNFTGTISTFTAGNYRDVILEKDSRVTFTGGTYNLRKLELKDNATLIFTASTTLNIQFKLRGHDGVAIFPGSTGSPQAGQNIKPDDLTINYVGISLKSDNSTTEDDDGEIDASFDDGSTSLTTSDKEKKDHKAGKTGRPVLFGERSFLNFRLTAPKASVTIGKESTLRGQVLAKKIRVKKDSAVSRNESFSKESDLTKIVEMDGVKFLGNEILVSLTNDGTFADADVAAGAVGGRVVGFDPNPPLYKIFLPTSSIASVENAVRLINDLHHPRIIVAGANLILEI